jgi:hypothetical protein
MIIWLARKASEAYEFGTFWENFEDRVAIKIPSHARADLAELFRQFCPRLMAGYVTPPEPGAFKHVEAFLFQAGLPLCHCHHFARLVQQVERRFGLPDPNAADAGEELRDHVLACSMSLGVPLLKRALRGPAGPLICGAALRVVLQGNYHGISPQLGKALADAFASQAGAQLRRAARSPYLRLSEHLTSLEIVGPRQDANLIGDRGLIWVVNGMSYPTPASDEFVFPLGDQPRSTVELRGLRRDLTASRTFVTRLIDRQQPFMLFDYESGRLRREESGSTLWLPPGDHYLLHASNLHLGPATDEYHWGDGQRTLSLLRVGPEAGATLSGPSGAWDFRAAAAPFLDVQGQDVLTDDGERIHFHWNNFPAVWRPHQPDLLWDASWSIQVTANSQGQTWELTEGEIRAGMMHCQPDGHTFLQSLRPGLHQIEVSVFRRERCELRQSFLVWMGLERYQAGQQFELSGEPLNLIAEQCQGFDIGPTVIRHRHDHLRQHRLAFDLGGSQNFHWSQAGTFLESFEKKAGRAIQPEPRKLGESFSASIDSARWLRVWRVPAADAALVVNGGTIQQMRVGSRHPFLDVSLAQLSTLYPDGGRISLRWRDWETSVATFARPLVPCRIQRSFSQGRQLLNFSFPDEVRWVKPRIHELASDRIFGFTGEALAPGGVVEFAAEGNPCVVCTRASEENHPAVPNAYAIAVAVSQADCPAGFWLVELEVRRKDTDDWQLVVDAKGRSAPLLVVVPADQTEASPRLQLLASAYTCGSRTPSQPNELDRFSPNRQELSDLLSEVLEIIKPGFPPELSREFRWLEALFRDLAACCGEALRETEEDEIARLLTLASVVADRSKPGWDFLRAHSLFVSVPGLLALDAPHYTGLSTAHPLPQALQWCGRLAQDASVVPAFRDLIEEVCLNPHAPPPETYGVLRLFQNFTQVLQGMADFNRFNYERYLTGLVGPIEQIQPHAEEFDRHTVLGPSHVRWALSQLAERRRATLQSEGLGDVNILLDRAGSFRDWLKSRLHARSQVMPALTWNRPWLQASLPQDSLIENSVRFASLFALAARSAGAGWLDFHEVTEWLCQHGTSRTEKTIATLVGLAPELFGYYLMFWELMIRTYPHE